MTTQLQLIEKIDALLHEYLTAEELLMIADIKIRKSEGELQEELENIEMYYTLMAAGHGKYMWVSTGVAAPWSLELPDPNEEAERRIKGD